MDRGELGGEVKREKQRRQGWRREREGRRERKGKGRTGRGGGGEEVETE